MHSGKLAVLSAYLFRARTSDSNNVNARFLFIIALANIFVLAAQIRTYRLLKAQKLLPPEERATNDDILRHMGGKMMRLFNKLFKFIDRPWKMYPLGFLFGLGFDTSTEVALLGIASVEATKGTSFWLLLLFPLVFTCGMCLIGLVLNAKANNRYNGWSTNDIAIHISWIPWVHLKTQHDEVISFHSIDFLVNWNSGHHRGNSIVISRLQCSRT